MTLGDEFQGDFSSLEAAVRASLLLHLGAVGTFRMRIGIGWGELSVEAPRGGAFGQDGPMWWRARDAIERAEELSDVRRTIVNTATTWDDFINDYLLARDQLIVDLDASNGDIARALISGVTQREIAESVGLHESSVSRRIRNHRLAVVAEFDDVRIPEFGSGT